MLSKQQQINEFLGGKQNDPKDVSATQFYQNGARQTSDEKVIAQMNCFQPNGIIDERDTGLNAFLNPFTQEDYERIPPHVKAQLERFTGSFEPSHSSAMDFMQENSQMPHDCNGKEIKTGDLVTVKFKVKAVHATEDYCNVDLESILLMPPELKYPVTLSAINTRQTEKVGE